MQEPPTIAGRLKKIMEEQGVGENELARRAGVTQPTIHRILKGESKSPRITNLEKISNALGITTTYLTQGELPSGTGVAPDRDTSDVSPRKPTSGVAVAHGPPILSALGPFGTLRAVLSGVTGGFSKPARESKPKLKLNHYPVISGSQASSTVGLQEALTQAIEKKYYETTGYTSKDVSFWLALEGDSMAAPVGVSPSLPEGTMVLLDSGKTPTPGKLVLAALHDGTQLTFRKLIKDSGQLYLKPLNPSYPLISLDNQTNVLAVAVEAKINL
ncbi:LexA family transcriptional regulator [Halomonas sp. SL1]|uniref:helix-turn-helix domain-containing protein n=1 Tax=Halomonas sp. SL1 TaxID=2137478 RepID=UPI000D16B440|nr:LexA family transcriptional regulator [Halomonas sp. SL1]RAH37799.1 helix-turn-helix domain-containing protein [Halomonas sp. SL1]